MKHRLGTRDPVAINNSLMFSERNADLELVETDFRDNKEKVSSKCKRHHI